MAQAQPPQLAPPTAAQIQAQAQPVVSPVAQPVAQAPVQPVAQAPVQPVASADTPFQLTFSQNEFASYWNTFTEGAKDPTSGIESAEQGFASAVVQTLAQDPYYKGMTYNALRTGEDPVLAKLGLEGKSLTDSQIIQLLASDDKGEPIRVTSDLGDATVRYAPPAGAAAIGLFKGVRVGSNLVSGLKPTNPYSAAARVAVPVATGGIYSVLASLGVQAAMDPFLPDEPLYLPGKGTKGAAMIKTAAEWFPYVVTPWKVPAKGFDLGARILYQNVEGFVGPMMKRTAGMRILGGIESMSERYAQNAILRPFPAGAVEVGAASAATIAGGSAEEMAPSNEWVKFGYTTGASIGGSVVTNFVVNSIPTIATSLLKGYRNLRSGWNKRSDVDPLKEEYGLSEAQLTASGDLLFDTFEKKGIDTKALLDALLNPEFAALMVDPSGNKINLPPAVQAASIEILALQHAYKDSMGSSGAEGASQAMKDAVEALRRGLTAMYANGSQEALGDAALIEESLFKGLLEQRIANSLNKLKKSYEQVRRPNTRPELFPDPDGSTIPDADIAPPSLEASEGIIEMLARQYKNGRNEESLLWKRIDQKLELSSFKNEQGVMTDVPNFVTMWQNKTGTIDDIIFEDRILKSSLSRLMKLVERTQIGLKLNPVEAASPIKMPAVRQQKGLDKAIASMDQEGDQASRIYQGVMDNFETEATPVNSMIEQLKEFLKQATIKDDEIRSLQWGANFDAKLVAKAFSSKIKVLEAQEAQKAAFAADAAEQATKSADAPVEPLSAYTLFQFRSDALAMGREFAAADGKGFEAGIANSMADAIQADIESLPVGINQQYDVARAFSRAFNDVFTRAYGGKVLGQHPNGAPRVSIPELANNMMKGDGAFFRTQQLNGISQFEVTQSLSTLLGADLLEATGSISGLSAEVKATGAKLLESFNQNVNPVTKILDMEKMRAWYDLNESAIKSIPDLDVRISAAMNDAVSLGNAEEVLLRTIRADALDPQGKLNPSSLSGWMNKESNQLLLNVFPSVKEDLLDVGKAKALLENVKIDNKVQKEAAYKVLGVFELNPNKNQNPAMVIADAIDKKQRNPWAVLDEYTKLIDNVGGTFTVNSGPNKGVSWSQQDLREGLRTAIYDVVLDVKSQGVNFRANEAYNALFSPHPNGRGRSVAEWMVDNNLLKEGDIGVTQRFLKEMAKIQAFDVNAAAGTAEEFLTEVGDGVKLLAAMGGSAAGNNLREMFNIQGASLVIQGRTAAMGERAAVKWFGDLPNALQSSRVGTILNNTELMIKMLKRGRSERESNAILGQVGQIFERNFIIPPITAVRGSSAVLSKDLSENVAREIVGAEVGDEIEGIKAVQPVPKPPQLRAPPPIKKVVPQSVQPAPSTNLNANPSRFNPQAAAPVSSGPVDRERFAALFPEDRDLMSGIGSLGGVA